MQLQRTFNWPLPGVIIIILAAFTLVETQHLASEICRGTYAGLSFSRDTSLALRTLQNRYSGCKKVIGNLEIVLPPELAANKASNFTNISSWQFLNDIVEVTGYVLVMRIPLTTLPLPSLQLIGGQILFQPTAVKSLFCSLCLIGNPSLTSFGFQNLTEISRGDVYVTNSDKLAYANTVNWVDLFASPSDEIAQAPRIENASRSTTGACHELCNSSFCFGPTLLECHYPTRVTCKGCSNRCLKHSPTTCCNQMCHGGCYNASDNGCHACQRVWNGGRCVSECPKRYTMDHRNRPHWNPKHRVEYAGECLEKCPSHMVDENGQCYAQCKPGNREMDNGTCVMCLPGDKCPIYCEGNDVPQLIVNFDASDYMSSDSIKRFSNCTHITGNILINQAKWRNITRSDLQTLSAVEVVTGYVSIEMQKHSLFTDYSFLGNLTTIQGRYLLDGSVLNLIDGGRLTQLAFRNLKRLSFGNVSILQSPCNANLINWTRLFGTPDQQRIRVRSGGPQQCENSYNCSSVCDPKAGCWGPSDTMCVACRNFQLDDTCVERCESPNSDLKFYVDPRFRTCKKCHPECAENCTGPNSDQCVGKCRHFQKGNECVRECGIGFWPAANGTCYLCHDFCEKGCNGPNAYVATKDRSGGCSDCFRTIVSRDGTKVCGSRVTQCEAGYAFDAKGADATVSGVQCTQCEEGCHDCFDNARKCQVCESARLVRSSLPPNIPANAIIARLFEAGYSFDIKKALNGNSTSTLEEYRAAYRKTLKSKPYALEDAPCVQLNTPNMYSPRGSYGCPVEPHGSYFMLRPKFDVTCMRQKEEVASDAANTSTSEPEFTLWMLNQPNYIECRQGDNLCLQCAMDCRDGCVGPTESDCNNCTYARIYHNEAEQDQGFKCVAKCPTETPWLWQETEPYCSSEMPPDERRKVTIITICVSVGVVLLVAAVVFTAVMLRRRAYDTMQTRKMEREIAGLGSPEEPLLETSSPPDMASLRLIKVTELKIGDMIGNGAFGTVYRGLWLPDSEKVKIPVAIKELTENSARASGEFLEEVRVMATVTHPCCVRIIGLCMGEKPLLVTPLMRFGSLLDYVREKESSLNSRTLLTWSMQIALGMTYLEDRCIVHRDLAARNVLVQNGKQVKITDFGLAKLVTDQSCYQAVGGKLPIKWLAIECITERKFTHKSDVWAFGVTLWEMFTFGTRPYATVSAFDMLALLQRGDRLEQPAICTIDVYTVMLKCWFHEPTSRPTFRELADTFARMSRDPGHYLHIETDKLARAPTTIDSNSAPDDAIMASLLDSCGDDSTGQTRQVVSADDYLCPVSSVDTSGYELNGSGQVAMNDLQRTDDPTDLPADYYAARSPQPEPIPHDAPPPPPPETDETDGSRYGALEAGKGRFARLKGNRLNSIDDRYAFDPVQFVSELERETERRRQHADDSGVVQLRKQDSPGASKLATSVPKSVQPNDVYLKPRPTDQPQPQPEYMEMRTAPQSIDKNRSALQPAVNRQTAPVSAGDVKPKVPVKANDRAKTNFDLFSAPNASPKQKIKETGEAEDTYLVAPSQPRPRQEPQEQETYVNMMANVRGGNSKAANSPGPGVAQNAEYFADGKVTAPKASLEEEELEEGNDHYVNMDVQQQLLRK